MSRQNKDYQQRAAFYIRVSTDDQVEKYGVDLQKAALEALIRSKGTLDDGTPAMVLAGENRVYVDEGISGTTEIEERPEFSRLMEDIVNSEKPFDVVIVYKIDRFARRLKVLLKTIDFFDEHEIKFISANESIDTSTPFGKAILGIVGVIAELEIETTKMRTQGGRLQAIERGVFMGQTPPFGYIKDDEKRLKPLAEEQSVVKDIFDWFVYAGLSPQQIADRLTNDEVLSPDASAVFHKKRKGEIKKRNKPYFWRLEKVRGILGDDIYMGRYWYGKTATDKKTGKVIQVLEKNWKLSKYQYSPLIQPDVFKRAQKLLNDSIKKVNLSSKRENDHLYLLSGLLRCDSCLQHTRSEEMMTWIGDRKALDKAKGLFSFYYKCGRKSKSKYSDVCTTLPIPAEPIEEYVLNFVKELLKNPEYVYKYHRNLKSTKNKLEHLESRRERLRSLLNSIPLRIENLKEQHAHGIISSTDELKKKIQEQEKNIKKHEEEIEKIDAELGKHTVSEGYLAVFKDFASKYSGALDELFDNREELYRLLHALIDKITIFSRPVTELDSIAGRKQDNQVIPWSIEIELRLPQEIIIDLAESKFRLRSSNL